MRNAHAPCTVQTTPVRQTGVINAMLQLGCTRQSSKGLKLFDQAAHPERAEVGDPSLTDLGRVLQQPSDARCLLRQGMTLVSHDQTRATTHTHPEP